MQGPTTGHPDDNESVCEPQAGDVRPVPALCLLVLLQIRKHCFIAQRWFSATKPVFLLHRTVFCINHEKANLIEQ